MISLDGDILKRDNDAIRRMIKYSEMLDSLDIVVFSKKKNFLNKISNQLSIHSTGSLNRYFYILDSFFICRDIIKKKNIDLIITQDPFLTGLVGYFLVFRKKIKLLVGVFGTNIFDKYWLKESFFHRIYKKIGKIVFKRANAIQTDGYETVDDLKEVFRNKVFWKPVIPSNIKKFSVNRKYENIDNKVNILYVGRLVKQKNLKMLIDVIKTIRIRTGEKKITFTIIGDGPLREYLESEIKKLGLNDFVRYTKFVKHEEIIEYFQKSDIFILTSYYEGFAKVFMEAASAGLPIVTTRVSGVRNIIKEDESGYVIDGGNVDEFCDKLRKLIYDEDKLRSMSCKISEDFSKKYNTETMNKAQLQIFKYLELN